MSFNRIKLRFGNDSRKENSQNSSRPSGRPPSVTMTRPPEKLNNAHSPRTTTGPVKAVINGAATGSDDRVRFDQGGGVGGGYQNQMPPRNEQQHNQMTPETPAGYPRIKEWQPPDLEADENPIRLTSETAQTLDQDRDLVIAQRPTAEGGAKFRAQTTNREQVSSNYGPKPVASSVHPTPGSQTLPVDIPHEDLQDMLGRLNWLLEKHKGFFQRPMPGYLPALVAFAVHNIDFRLSELVKLSDDYARVNRALDDARRPQQSSKELRSQIDEYRTSCKRLSKENETLKANQSARETKLSNLNATLSYQNQTLNSNLKSAHRSYQQQVDDITQKYEKGSDALKQRHSKELRDFLEKHSSELAGQAQKYEAELTSALNEAQEAQNRANFLDEQHKHEVKEINAKHTRELAETQSRNEQQVKQLRLDFHEEAAVRKKEHEAKVTTLQSQFDQSRSAMEQAHKDQVASYEADVEMYKKALTTSVDSVPRLTDAELKDNVAQLKNAVETLSRAPFWAKPAPDMAALGEISAQGAIASSMPSKHRKYLLESAIWGVLMRGIFALPLGLSSVGSEGGKLVQLWSQLFPTASGTTSNGVDIPAPESLGEQWRSITTEALRQNALGERAATAGSNGFRKTYLQNQAAVQEELVQLLAQVSSVQKQGDIQAIVQRASMVAVLFGTQRARLEMCLPGTGQSAAALGYEVSVCNESDAAQAKNRLIQFGVSPGLRKWGNAKGASLDAVTCLLPALVYAEPA